MPSVEELKARREEAMAKELVLEERVFGNPTRAAEVDEEVEALRARDDDETSDELDDDDGAGAGSGDEGSEGAGTGDDTGGDDLELDDEPDEQPAPRRSAKARLKQLLPKYTALKKEHQEAITRFQKNFSPEMIGWLGTADGQRWQRDNWQRVVVGPPGASGGNGNGAGEADGDDAGLTPAELLRRMEDLNERSAQRTEARIERRAEVNRALVAINKRYQEIGYNPKVGADLIRNFMMQNPLVSADDAFFATHPKLVKGALAQATRERGGVGLSRPGVSGSPRPAELPSRRRGRKHPIEEAADRGDTRTWGRELEKLFDQVQ